jgi:hypothetical protein
MPYYFFTGGLGGCGGCGAGCGVTTGFLPRSLIMPLSPAAEVTLTLVKTKNVNKYFI